MSIILITNRKKIYS